MFFQGMKKKERLVQFILCAFNEPKLTKPILAVFFLLQGNTVEPPYNERPNDSQNLLDITRFRYIEVPLYCLEEKMYIL